VRLTSCVSQSTAGYLETDQPNPLSAYGRSKASGEKFLLTVGPGFYLIRTSWLYGRSGKNFVETVINLAKERPSLKVVNDQVGAPTWARDLALAVKQLLIDSPADGIYHLTASGSAAWFEVAQKIVAILGLNCRIEPQTTAELDRPAKRPAYSILINSKRPALRPWPEMLAAYLENQ